MWRSGGVIRSYETVFAEHYDVGCHIVPRNKWGANDVIMPTLVNATMLEVYYVAAAWHRKLHPCRVLCLELNTARNTRFSNKPGATNFHISAFQLTPCCSLSIPSTWRRGFRPGSVTEVNLVRLLEKCLWCWWLQVVFNRNCNSQDIVELLAQAAGVNR